MLIAVASGRMPEQTVLSPRDAVRIAFQKRKAVLAAQSAYNEARNNAAVLGAYPQVHLETGIATRPDVVGGEDLTLFLPVDAFGRVSAARRQARADLESALATFRQSLLDIQSDVLSAYVDLTAAQALLGAAESSLDLAKRLKAAADAQFEARAIAEVQRTRSNFELRKAEQVVDDRKAAVDAAKRRFEAALGIEGRSDAELSFHDLAATSLGIETPATMRPDVLLLQSNLDRANADRKAAQLLQAPTMEIQLRRSPWSSDQEQYGGRLQFFVPIWDDGAAKSTYRAANARRELAVASLEDKSLSVLKEQEAARIEFIAATASVASYNELLKEATQMVEKVQHGFELGGATVLDVIEAKRAYNDTQEQFVAAQQRLSTAGAALLKSRGELLTEVKP